MVSFLLFSEQFLDLEIMPPTFSELPPTSRPSGSAEKDPVELPQPFAEHELERAKTESQELLRKFGGHQSFIENSQLGLQIPQEKARYDEIIDQMNGADLLFGDGQFEEALAEYQDTSQLIETYRTGLMAKFEQSITAAEEVFLRHVNRDAGEMAEHIELAREVKPIDMKLTELDALLLELPRFNELILMSDRAELRGDLASASQLLKEATEVVQEHPALETRQRDLAAAIAKQTFESELDEAFKLLKSDQTQAAIQHFNAILARSPRHPGATAGLVQAQRKDISIQIAKLKAQVTTAVETQEYASAVKLYNELLQLDPNLQFALEGRKRVQDLRKAHRELDAILADPHALAFGTNFDKAEEAVMFAKTLMQFDSTLSSKVSNAQSAISFASQQVNVVLVSDTLMEIRMTSIGEIEPFDRKELSVRPGRYVIQGSRLGCRDIRKTVIVQPNMDPVELYCEDPL